MVTLFKYFYCVPLGPELAAKTYHIKNNGSDTDGCGAIESPCLTVG